MNTIFESSVTVIQDTDSYKLGHFKQYPEGTTAMSSYFESRGGDYDSTVFFGLQYIIKKHLTHRVTVEEVGAMNVFAKKHGLSFNYEGWMHIATNLSGRLPVKIRAVPEGSVIPVNNILMDVTSTDPKSFWIVSWLETILSRLWYPTTVATRSWYAKQLIKGYLEETSDGDPNVDVMFKLHDFGSRGVSCQEQAMIGGAAHLINFRGSDTLAGIHMLAQYYGEEMAGFSIEASEHSTMTMRGKDGEVEMFRNMIKQYGDNPIFACVSDSYDIYDACANLWGGELKQEVLDMKAMLVVRPDSGDPLDVTLKCINILADKFGTTTNSKGYKVLNNVRLIWGDGIEVTDVEMILLALKNQEFSADNIAFGMGGGLLQKLDRDTQRFAFKASWAKIDGKSVDIYKEPTTDAGKNSKRGRLDLIAFNGPGKCKDVSTCKLNRGYMNSVLETVYENGVILKTITLEEVRKNSEEKVYKQYKGWKDMPEVWDNKYSNTKVAVE